MDSSAGVIEPMDLETGEILPIVGGDTIPTLLGKAERALAGARTSGEVLEARDMARVAYDAAKSAGRMARAKQAHDEILSAVYRAQGHALTVEARAKMLLADEYDAAQDRGEVAKSGQRTDLVGKGNEVKPTAADLGLRRDEIYEARQLRDADRESPGIIEGSVEAILQRGEEPTKAAVAREIEAAKHVRGTFGTGENEWYTPDEYLEKARAALGGFDLDPASSEAAQTKVKATEYFDIERDGLAQEWRGRVWMNPPYAQPAIGQFMAKLCEEVQAGRTTAAIALTHNYTDTRWFQDTAQIASAICLTRGRIRFYSPKGEVASPTQGQAFFYFGGDVDGFAREFVDVGLVVRVMK